MPVFPTARRVLPALGLVALAVPSLAAAAPDPSIAAPNSYEQITRADGPQGATTLSYATSPEPVFASDLGLTAAYSNKAALTQILPIAQSTVVRNTVTNRSTDLGLKAGELLQADRTETTGLFRRLVIGADGSYTRVYDIASLNGSGPVKDLPITYQYATPILSGDGRSVVISDDQGVRRLTIATGAWTQIAPVGILETHSVSDDGQTIAGIDYDPVAQQISVVVWKGSQRTVLVPNYTGYAGPGSGPQLSADGSTVFLTQPGGDYPAPTTLTVIKLATGKTTTTTLPFTNVYGARPVWVSPTGDQIAFALGYQSPDDPREPAKVFDAISKTWSTFGGPFATSITNALDSSVQPTAISRNGRFAALPFNDQVALVNLAGGPVLGNVLGLEPVSASSYLDTLGLDGCGFGYSSSFTGSFTRPAAWLKAPRSARITVSNGSTVLSNANWTKSEPLPNSANVNQDFVTVQFPLGTKHTRNVRYSVVDGDGRQLSENYSATLTCGAAG